MHIAFRLKPGRDDDLILWINNSGEGDRSHHIRQAIRQGLSVQTSAVFSPVINIRAKQTGNNDHKNMEVDLEAAFEQWI